MTETLLTFLQTLTTPSLHPIVRGAFIFQPGDHSHVLHGIASGSNRMVRYNEAGEEIIIYRAGPGQTFAEAALFSDIFHCGAVAETDCQLLLFDKQKILTAMDNEPNILRQYNILLSHQVRDLRSLLEIRSIRSAPDRIMHYLRLQAAPDGCCVFSHSFKDLAGLLGLAHETLYRSLRKLEEEGAITRQGREIIVVHKGNG